MNRARVIAFTALIAVSVLGATVAFAAPIGSVSGTLFASRSSVTAPAPTRAVTNLDLTTTGGPPTVTGVVLTVTGSSLATLNGQSATLVLTNSAGAQVQAVTATLATGTNLAIGTTATITLAVPGAPLATSFAGWSAYIGGTTALGGGADATARAITLGSGAVTAPSWTNPVVPPGGANPATTIATITPSNVTTYSTCLTVSITGTSSAPAAWAFTIDYSKPPYWGVQPQVDSHAVIASNVGSVLTLQGTTNGNAQWEEWGNNALLTNARTLNVLVCVYNVGQAPDTPEAYTVSAQSHGPTWTNTKACVRRTVTGNGIYPFYFGWATTFDMTEAIALLKTNDAGSPRAFSYQANPTTPGSYVSGTSTYAMSSYRDNEVIGTSSTVAELCVVQY